MVESAPAVANGAPDMTHFLHVKGLYAPGRAGTYGAPPVVTYPGPYAVTCSLQPQVALAVTYMSVAPVAPAPAFSYSVVPQVSPAVTHMGETGKGCSSICSHVLLICSVECLPLI